MNRRDFLKSLAAGVGVYLLDSSLNPLELLANVQGQKPRRNDSDLEKRTEGAEIIRKKVMSEKDISEYVDNRYKLMTSDEGTCPLLGTRKIIHDTETGIYFLQRPLFGTYTKKEALEKLDELNRANFLGFNDWALPSAELVNKQILRYVDEETGKKRETYLIGRVIDTSNQQIGVWLYNSLKNPICPHMCDPKPMQSFLSDGRTMLNNRRAQLQPVRRQYQPLEGSFCKV